jgi:hypothetical protein
VPFPTPLGPVRTINLPDFIFRRETSHNLSFRLL